MKGKNLKKNLDTFLEHIDSIMDTLPMTMLLLDPYNKKANDDFLHFFKNNVEEIEDDKGEKRLLVKSDESKLFEKLERNASTSSLAAKIIPESLFVSMISQYDAYLNRLLRAIFELTPEILNTSDRNLTFSQIVEMGSISDAREYIIEKEVETVLRKSHSDQFEYLELRLKMELRKNLPIWQMFIEITERRNLLVHCDGVISNQYIKNCKDHNCDVSNVKIGERLDIPAKYFVSSYKCLYEIAVKLTHTIWRKLAKDDLENADRFLNNTCFDLINNYSFELADNLLQFACDQKHHFDDALKNVLIINAALSKYLQDKKEEAVKILNKKDWSATSDDFKLANAVIQDKYEEAYIVMIKIGKNGDVDKSDYKQWPVFSKIRKEEKFKETYKSIFGEEYMILETPKSPVQEIIEKEIKKNKKLKKIMVTKVDSAKEIKSKEAKSIKKKTTKNKGI